MTDITLADIQHDRNECKIIIERGAKFEKLLKNREFKELIVEGYFKEELTRLADMLALANEESKVRIQAEIESIARFKQFINMPATFAKQAEAHLVQLAEVEEELLNPVEFDTAYEG